MNSLFLFKDFMPFSDIYISTFKKDIEYNQLIIQTAVALQTNKFIQVTKWLWELNSKLLDAFQHVTLYIFVYKLRKLVAQFMLTICIICIDIHFSKNTVKASKCCLLLFICNFVKVNGVNTRLSKLRP